VENRIEHKPNLDVFRALCVLLVLATHVLGSFQMASIEKFSNGFRHIWYFGSFGVTGFFVLSAFLLTSILYKEKEIGKYSVRNFYVRRILRIYPLYFVTIFTIAFFNIIYSLSFDLHIINFATFTANFLSFTWEGSSPILHFWSICAEEQFYLFLPWLLLLEKRKINIICGVLIPISFLSRFIVSQNLAYPAVWNFSTSHLDAFAIGMLIAINLDGIKKRITSTNPLTLFMLLGFVILIVASATKFELVYTSGFTLITYFLAASSFGALLILANIKTCNFKGKFLLEYLGQRSFGIYVFHWPVLFYFKFLLGLTYLDVPQIFIVIFITLCLSELSYQYLEKPFMKLRLKFQSVRNN
jgi:peptidoglycan/LPS O-acetylase OafA/YrhL